MAFFRGVFAAVVAIQVLQGASGQAARTNCSGGVEVLKERAGTISAPVCDDGFQAKTIQPDWHYATVGKHLAMPHNTTTYTATIHDDQGNELCRGSLVSTSWVLTSASCVGDCLGDCKATVTIGMETFDVAEVRADPRAHVGSPGALSLVKLDGESAAQPIEVLSPSGPHPTFILGGGSGLLVPHVASHPSAWRTAVVFENLLQFAFPDGNVAGGRDRGTSAPALSSSVSVSLCRSLSLSVARSLARALSLGVDLEEDPTVGNTVGTWGVPTDKATGRP